MIIKGKPIISFDGSFIGIITKKDSNMRRKLTFELAIEELKKARGCGFKVYLEDGKELFCKTIGFDYVCIVDHCPVAYEDLYIDPIKENIVITWKQHYTSFMVRIYHKDSSHSIVFPSVQIVESIKGEFLGGCSYKLTANLQKGTGTIVEIPNEDTKVGTKVKYVDDADEYTYTTYVSYMLNLKDIQIVSDKEYFENVFKRLDGYADKGTLNVSGENVRETLKYFFKELDEPLKLLSDFIEYLIKDRISGEGRSILIANLSKLPYKDLSKTMIEFLQKNS
jgi:hypothetical protein